VEQKAPSIRERWSRSRPTKRLLFWACVATMVATIVVGFSWGGWTTGSKARYAADGMVTEALAKRLAPICVVQFKADPDRAQKLKQLNQISSYEQSDYVKKQGWATIAGEAEPNSRVADECVKLLAQSS
jgi:predicted DNA-binding protein (MmcQ/YjbR family)